MSSSLDIERLGKRFNELTVRMQAIEEAPLGITIADMTADDEPLVYANGGFERITGYTEDEILGRNCRFMQGEQTDEEGVAEMRRAIDAGESTKVTLRNYRNDGTCFWNEITLAPLPDDGEIPYYVGFQQDVTLRKEYEQRLKEQRDDLNVLSQMVRHDVRNDLQLTLSSLELLDEFVSPGGQEYLETARDSTRQAIELTFSAGEMATTVLADETEFVSTDLRETLWNQIEQARSANPDATVTVEGTLPSVTIQANDLLESVFRNLITNAIQHNDAESPTVTISAVTEDGVVEVAVADNGPGIPDDQKEQMFSKGVRGEQSGNTGIGLYLVDRLVRNYGGDVWVEDRADAQVPVEEADEAADGSVFFVQLPLAE